MKNRENNRIKNVGEKIKKDIKKGLSKTRLMLLFLLVLAIVAFYYFGLSKYLTIENIKTNRLLLQQAIEKNYIVAVLGFIAIYIALAAITLPFAVLLTVVSGFLFGTFWGAIYSNIAATIGSALAFLQIRYIFGGWLHKRFGHRLKTFRKEFKKYGSSYLLSIHFSSVVPLFVINILAALANVSFWTFVWTTSLGTLPGFFVYAFAGKQFTRISSIKDIFSWKIILAFALLAILAMIPVILRKLLRKKDKLEHVEF